MSFAYPVIVYSVLGILLPGCLMVALWSGWRRKRDLEMFGQPGLVAQLTRHLSPRRRLLGGLTFLAGVLLLGIAWAGPLYGAKMVEVLRQGVDVMIALDVSQSMLAEDVRPNRMQRAQQELTALVDHLGGDRVGVVAFAGSAQMACPLTTDYAAAKMFLQYLTPASVPVPGTEVGTAIRTALQVFPQGSEGYRVLVLLTDGEDHDSKVLEAAKEAKAAGVKILCIGFGTPEGEPIPIRDEKGKISRYVKDASGQTVLSRLDEGTLRQITEITGGAYLPAHHGSLEAKQIADLIDQMRKRDLSGGQYGALENRYQYFLLPALLLLLFSFWLPARRSSWLVAVAALWLIPQLSAAGTAEDVNKGNRQYKKGKYEDSLRAYRDAQIKSPENPIVHYNLGNTLHHMEKHEEAEKAYQRALASKDKALRAQTLYNLGNNYFSAGKYGEAVKHYREALKVKPRDEDTIYNLAQAIVRLKNPPSQQEKTEQQNKKSKQQQQKKEDKSQNSEKQEPQDQGQKQPQQGGEEPRPAGLDDKGEKKGEPGQQQQTPMDDKPARRPRPGEMQPEEAENILNAVREAEKEIQKERLRQLQQQPAQRGKKYW